MGLLVDIGQVDFIACVLFLKAVGMREYCCMAIESRVEALCFVRSPRATCASRSTMLGPSALVALDMAESRQSYSNRRSRCWQNDIDSARCCHLMIHAAGGRS